MPRLLSALILCLTLGACLAPQGPGAAPDVSADLPADLPPGATPEFAQAVARVAPVAIGLCREMATAARSCAFRFAVDSRPDLPPNAFQTLDRRGRPWVVFTAALIAGARNVDELAFVLGHESAHHIAGHLPLRDAHAREGAVLAGVLATAAGASAEEVREAQVIGANLAAAQYSRRFELEADALGTEIAWRAGFDPLRGAAYFARLPDPGDVPGGSHPSNGERMALVAEILALLQRGAVPASAP